MKFRVVFWDVLPCKMIIQGSTSQKTNLNFKTNIVNNLLLPKQCIVILLSYMTTTVQTINLELNRPITVVVQRRHNRNVEHC
jgi:hypothetical protein